MLSTCLALLVLSALCDPWLTRCLPRERCWVPCLL